MFLLLLACTKPTAPVKPPTVQPRVPSLQAPMYIHVEQTPRDSFVAKVWGKKVDESLSGAAGALALRLLEDKPLDSADVRWRAVLAGYPWPIREARTQRVAQDEVPTDLLAAAQTHTGEDIGLVRARGNAGDQWVMIVGARRGTLPAFLREPQLGSSLTFPGNEVVAVAPGGTPISAHEALKVDQPGEWLVSLSDVIGEITSFPLYVGRPAPQAPPFAGAASAEDAGDFDEELLLRLDTLDAWYQRDPAERDPVLDSVARVRLQNFVAGKPLPDAGKQLASAGYFDGTASTCRAATVAACLDQMWWSTGGHAALSVPWRTLGMAVAPTADGVAIVVTTADRSATLRP